MQAYHNELVGKVSRLEEENMKLKKEKVRNFKILRLSLSVLCLDLSLYMVPSL